MTLLSDGAVQMLNTEAYVVRSRRRPSPDALVRRSAQPLADLGALGARGSSSRVRHEPAATLLGVMPAMRNRGFGARDRPAIVTQLTGRTVVAMMSANHIDPDLAAEVFVLDDLPAAARE